MTEYDLINEYFEWMYQLVCNDRYYKRLSYRKLLYLLNDIEFIPRMELDENRARDGIDFRYRFGYENRYPSEYIDECFGDRPCSILEMMIALSFRVEEQIMDDPDYGDRTGQWFWNMIVSLGLGTMSDAHFDRNYTEVVIGNFLDREYAPNGKGGLFTIENYPHDLRDVEIWTQFMWYLNDVNENRQTDYI